MFSTKIIAQRRDRRGVVDEKMNRWNTDYNCQWRHEGYLAEQQKNKDHLHWELEHTSLLQTSMFSIYRNRWNMEKMWEHQQCNTDRMKLSSG